MRGYDRRITPFVIFLLDPENPDELATELVILLRALARRMRRLPPPSMCIEIES